MPWFFQFWNTVLLSEVLLLARQERSVGSRPDHIHAPLGYQIGVHQNHAPLAYPCCTRSTVINSMLCVYGELPSASQRVGHTRAAVTDHRYELEVLIFRTSQFIRCFLPVYICAWNGPPDVVFESGSSVASKEAVNRWCLLSAVFFPVVFGLGTCGVARPCVALSICKTIVFPHLGLHCLW